MTLRVHARSIPEIFQSSRTRSRATAGISTLYDRCEMLDSVDERFVINMLSTESRAKS
jgi:hypothetical protein